METMIQSLPELIKAVSGIWKEDVTYSDYLALRSYCVEQETEIKAILNACKKDELKKYYQGYSDAKKDQIVSSVYNSILMQLLLSDSVSVDYMNKETMKQACVRMFAETTPEAFAAYQAKKQGEHAEHVKALTNPETLYEFQTFARYRGEGAMSDEQRERYDELRTGQTREERAEDDRRRAQIQAVDTGGVEMTGPIKTQHTRDKYDLWIVQLVGKVERPIYNELNEKAKRLGGWYSSFRGNGAIPGFQFKEERGAIAFMNLQNGAVDASDIYADRQTVKAERRAENLEDKGERLKTSAEQDLSVDRKDNTAKRAREAANAERRALYQIEFGKLMQLIADGQRDGTIRYLDKVANYTDIETLYSLISAARWRYIRDKNINPDHYDDEIPDLVNYVKYPYPVANLEKLHRILYNLAGEPGKRMAANRLIKLCARAQKAGKEMVRFNASLDDYDRVLCAPSRVVDSYELDNYRDMRLTYTRLQRMGLKEEFELRTALREMLKVKKAAALDPEVKKAQDLRELERTFVGREIPGFFPTPADLAAEIVGKADIKNHDMVAELSAGIGHLADAIRQYCSDTGISIAMHLNELRPDFCDILKKKGFENVTCCDFLSVPERPAFNRIIINPPFENGEDVAHVQHAFKFLKPGGRLVAIMAGNKDQKRFSDFRSWVEQHGGVIEPNEPGAFLSAFRPTGVSSCTLIIDK